MTRSAVAARPSGRCCQLAAREPVWRTIRLMTCPACLEPGAARCLRRAGSLRTPARPVQLHFRARLHPNQLRVWGASDVERRWTRSNVAEVLAAGLVPSTEVSAARAPLDVGVPRTQILIVFLIQRLNQCSRGFERGIGHLCVVPKRRDALLRMGYGMRRISDAQQAATRAAWSASKTSGRARIGFSLSSVRDCLAAAASSSWHAEARWCQLMRSCRSFSLTALPLARCSSSNCNAFSMARRSAALPLSCRSVISLTPCSS